MDAGTLQTGTTRISVLAEWDYPVNATSLSAIGRHDSGDARATRLLSLAKVAADRSAAGASRCLQAKGGIGFTRESDVHRYLKQALRLRQWLVPHQQLRASVRPDR